MPLAGEVHGALRVREAWLGCVGRRNVEVVASDDQAHLLARLGGLGGEGGAHPSVLVLQVREDHVRLEDCLAVAADERWHFAEWVERLEVWGGEVRVGDGARVDTLAHISLQ